MADGFGSGKKTVRLLVVVGGAMLGPHMWAVCGWTGLKRSWLSEQGFLLLSGIREDPHVPRGCASAEKTNAITSRSVTVMASGVWWLLAGAKFPGTTMGSTGKLHYPRARR